MKRKLFIGSSSESIRAAEYVKDIIDSKCSKWLNTSIWNEPGMFDLNKSATESLIKHARLYDYGVFIANSDDTVISRGKAKEAPRDNVIFELGMFLGSLGMDRAFVITSVELQSDMAGLITTRYQNGLPSESAIRQLVAKIESTKDSYRLGYRQSTALALGYFRNFLMPVMEKLAEDGDDFKLQVLIPRKITDLKNTIRKYSRLNKSTYVEIISGEAHLYKRECENRAYWDIPRLLKTLFDLVVFIEPQKEMGDNPALNSLLEIELDNFYNALRQENIQIGTFTENLDIMRI